MVNGLRVLNASLRGGTLEEILQLLFLWIDNLRLEWDSAHKRLVDDL